jgi:hypothetical protein
MSQNPLNAMDDPMDSVGEIRWRIPIPTIPLKTYRRCHRVLMSRLSRQSRRRILTSAFLIYGLLMLPVLGAVLLLNPYALAVIGSVELGDTRILQGSDLLIALWLLAAIILILVGLLIQTKHWHLLATLHEAATRIQCPQTLTIGEDGVELQAPNYRHVMLWRDALAFTERKGDWFLHMNVLFVVALPTEALATVPDREVLRDFVRTRITSAAGKGSSAVT